MKKIVFLILALVLCLCTVQVFADGEGYASISTAYIDYTPIDSYIISDLTYIEVENLANYGFDVAFDETAQSYNVSRIKFATPMYTREMWKEEASVKTDIKTETGNVKVYLDGQLANSYCANGKTLVQFDELQKYGKVVWNDYYRKLNVYIFREEMQNELDNAENVVEIEIGEGTYKGQVDENNQPHGIGRWTDDHDHEGEFEYLGYFTHSKPDGLMYKKTYRTVSRSYVARNTYFIGKVDGSKEAERRYEYVEPEMKYDEYYGWVKVKEGYNILVGRDANFGVAYLPEKEIPTFYGHEDDFYDKTIYTEGCYYEEWSGKDGTHEHRIWHNGNDKQTVLHYSFGAGDNREAINSVRRLGTDTSHLSTFYEYINGKLIMHTGYINTKTKNGVNNPVDGAGTFITVLLNDKDVTFDVLPVKENNRVLVPVRAIAEALGAKVTWNDAESKIVIEKDGKNILLQIANNVMEVDGRKITLDVAPKIIDGRTMVPVRTVSEAFDAKVDWNNELQQVIIDAK